MMKCTICGRHTLPGAKLCLPCRSALRRARDDTISELLPLPRRVEALAVGGAETLGQAVDMGLARKRGGGDAPGAVRRPSRFASVAVALFVLAIGVLAYGFGEQLRQDPQTIIAERIAQPTHAGVSPWTMAAEARRTTQLAPLPDIVDTTAEPAQASSVAPPGPLKARKATAPPSRSVKAPIQTAAEVVPVPAVVANAPEPAIEAPAALVVPDRWQSLSATLARCSVQNPFARTGCEHAARAQFCDGYWGQVAQCPAGIPNDHGQ